jgi:IS30 family transposase
MERWGRHLDGAERAVILAEHRRGTRQREIGRFLGRSASTIRRELGRGRVWVGLLSAGWPARPYPAAVAVQAPAIGTGTS